jgi:hypothetical protein
MLSIVLYKLKLGTAVPLRWLQQMLVLYHL